MNRYFLVLDKKNRLVYRQKLDRDSSEEGLLREYQKLDFKCYLITGKTFSNAVSEKGLQILEEGAFYIKRDLKEKFFLTDKSIKDLLGKPDFVDKVQGSSDHFMHKYSKTRVEEILDTPDYKAQVERIKSRREKKTKKVTPKGTSDSFFQKGETRIQRSRKEFGEEFTEESGKDFGSFVRKFKRSDSSANRKLKMLVAKLGKDWDLSRYKEFFPVARDLKRKHIFFVGPTNSGKSYRGFNELVEGESGVYLAPLRLLALEGQEEVEKRGQTCSLLTGEEVDFREGANFVASTVEMANLENPVDCALIDEVQLILDDNRGWAWSQAIVGLPAKKILMTGSEESVPTLRKLIEEYLGEELEIIKLDRIGELKVLPKPIRNLTQVESGSAIIAFSRRAVLGLKRELEEARRSVSVLYGNLSPGVRREEARRFKAGETNILVATDCIGMGLNLPIQSVIFSETAKFDGKVERSLSISEIKQIAGRAGRYGKFECGYVGGVSGSDLQLVSMSLAAQIKSEIRPCFVRPTLDQLEVLGVQLGDNSIKSAISLFSQLRPNTSMIVCSNLEEMLKIADRIDRNEILSNLSFRDKYLFSCAPIPSADAHLNDFIGWLERFAMKAPVELKESHFSRYLQPSGTNEDRVLNDAENSVKILTTYHWLARKKHQYFPSLELCEDLRNKINMFIENSLKTKGLHKKCTECFKKLPFNYHRRVCHECFHSSRRRT